MSLLLSQANRKDTAKAKAEAPTENQVNSWRLKLFGLVIFLVAH
jgi:hypothetical protein